MLEAGNPVESIVAQLLRRIFTTLCAGLALVVGLAFYTGVFMARTDSRLATMERDMSTIREQIVAQLDTRLRSLERVMDRGSFPATDVRLQRLEKRLDEIHHSSSPHKADHEG